MKPLNRRSQQLFDALDGRGDVQIRDLCAAVGNPGAGNGHMPSAQRWLGIYITRLNRRLAPRGMRVKPGAIKGSYRLTGV